ncbi:MULTISPECIES: transglycosylase SLT domain-containing protein [unclassified Acinetobacter]|uniref:Lytic transglycosylase domain-containing protein n=1 Tax=Acinetobacter sichuanensis TaxID=2136183 RepID=A0A371YN29_9GAMM|nr:MULTISPECIES: transglycosylase SLT domain-containing protein [unclassified Acinetobacter]MDM1248734.1 transglycosylase SLT domain-containing protein [Acinetobacter sp. R933-2]MDM1765830.1 transglycosylase SLT domain-containing protein [Acinetobacter sp. 226-1]MDM1769528.1 transglycosylase SLT domain-containing protein [Acinetobacter sp. 226-4]RFC82734.1 lytic transglycosylase domain-containing protein [Acinetobacter sichuanensis]
MGTSLVVTGCASVDNGSLEKRSLLLATGIQKAYSVETTTAQRIAPMILQHAEQYDVDPLLLAAMIRQESSYRSGVISPAGAVGLTQVIPRYWQQTCQGDLFDENTNIQCGTFILAKYNKSAGSWKKALAYYNVGPTGYHSSWKMKRQGNRYAEQVEEHQKQLKNEL